MPPVARKGSIDEHRAVALPPSEEDPEGWPEEADGEETDEDAEDLADDADADDVGVAGGASEEAAPDGAGSPDRAAHARREPPLPAATLHQLWQEARQLYRAWLTAQDDNGRKRATRYNSAGRHFVDWAIAHGYAPDQLPPDAVKRFLDWAEVPDRRIGRPTKHIASIVGRDMVDRIYLDHPRANQRATGETMSGQEQAQVDGGAGGGGAQPQVQVQAPQPQAQPATVRVEVAAPRQQRAARQVDDAGGGGWGTGRGARKDLFTEAAGGPSNFQQFRVYKRVRGKAVLIDDYSMADAGGNLQRFVKTQIDPYHADPSGFTQYELYRLDAGGNDVPPGLAINIESQPAPSGPENPMDKVREAVDLVEQLSARARDGGTEKELLEVAKQRAVTGQGSMVELMMMMMMSKMMSGGGGDDVDKVVRVLERFRQHEPTQPSALPQMPFPATPPSPPPPSELVPVVTKLMDHAMAPPRSAVDTLKEIAAIKDLFVQPPRGPDPEVVALRAELSALKDAIKEMAQRPPPAPGGLDESIKNFERITGMVKTLAPALNMGGITGVIQSFFTPALASTMGNAMAFAINKIRTVPQTVAQTPTQPGAPQTPPMPAGAQQFIDLLKEAKQEPEQIMAVLNILQVYWLDPAWQPRLAPYMQAIATGDAEKAKEPVLDILRNARPDLAASADFVGRCVNTLIASIREYMAEQQAPAQGVGVGTNGATVTPASQAPQQQPQTAQVVQFPKQPERPT